MTASFYDANGRLISTIGGSLSPGKPGLLDFNPAASGGGGGAGRVAVRAEVTVEADANGFTPSITATLEIIEIASGKTDNVLIALL